MDDQSSPLSLSNETAVKFTIGILTILISWYIYCVWHKKIMDMYCEKCEKYKRISESRTMSLPRRLVHKICDGWKVYETNKLCNLCIDSIKYCAISHVWGKTESQGKCYRERNIDWEIFVDDKSKIDTIIKDVFDNKLYRVSCFWMDILCLPQGDQNKKERSKELSDIGEYYNQASYTYVYMKNIDQSIDNIYKYHRWNRQLNPPRNYKDILGDLIKIAKSDWYKGVWTMQELHANSNVYLKGEHKMLEYKHLVKICEKFFDWSRIGKIDINLYSDKDGIFNINEPTKNTNWGQINSMCLSHALYMIRGRKASWRQDNVLGGLGKILS
jgi:Heterokaryon incompatibility protein (HET)